MPELPENEFLSSADIVGDTIIEFTEPHQIGEIPKEGDEANVKTIEILVKLPTGKLKTWTMNKTSQKAIAKTYSINTDIWVGKKAVLFTSKQLVHGVMKDVIYAHVPVVQTAAQPAPPVKPT